MDQGSGFDIIIFNTYLLHSMGFGWLGSFVSSVSCLLDPPSFLIPFGRFCVVLTIIVLNSVILLFWFGLRLLKGSQVSRLLSMHFIWIRK